MCMGIMELNGGLNSFLARILWLEVCLWHFIWFLYPCLYFRWLGSIRELVKINVRMKSCIFFRGIVLLGINKSRIILFKIKMIIIRYRSNLYLL